MMTFQVINGLGDTSLFKVCKGGSPLLHLGTWKTSQGKLLISFTPFQTEEESRNISGRGIEDRTR